MVRHRSCARLRSCMLLLRKTSYSSTEEVVIETSSTERFIFSPQTHTTWSITEVSKAHGLSSGSGFQFALTPPTVITTLDFRSQDISQVTLQLIYHTLSFMSSCFKQWHYDMRSPSTLFGWLSPWIQATTVALNISNRQTTVNGNCFNKLNKV